MEASGAGYQDIGYQKIGTRLIASLQQNAFRVFDLQALVYEPFGGGAAAVADAVLAAGAAGAAAHVAIESEEGGIAPDVLKAVVVEIACLKFWSLEEGAGVDLAFGTDAAGGGGRAAHIESGQLVAKGVEVEERIGGQHIGMRAEPVGKCFILFACGVQFIPNLLASTGGAQAGDAQFSIETGGNLIQAIQFGETIARQDAVDGQAELLCRQQFQAAHGPCEDALAANAIVGAGGAAVQADLKIDGVELCQAARAFRRNQRAIGADAHHKLALAAAFERLPDTGIEKGFAAAKVYLKDLHLGQFVHQRQ